RPPPGRPPGSPLQAGTASPLVGPTIRYIGCPTAPYRLACSSSIRGPFSPAQVARPPEPGHREGWIGRGACRVECSMRILKLLALAAMGLAGCSEPGLRISGTLAGGPAEEATHVSVTGGVG